MDARPTRGLLLASEKYIRYILRRIIAGVTLILALVTLETVPYCAVFVADESTFGTPFARVLWICCVHERPGFFGFALNILVQAVKRQLRVPCAVVYPVAYCGLPLPDTVSAFVGLGVTRCRSTVHNWVRKANLQPASGENPNHVVIDEAVIQLNDERFWLYATVSPDADQHRLSNQSLVG